MAEYWLYAWDLATDAGNTKPMWSVSRAKCQACANYGNEADAVIHAGGTIVAIHTMTLLGARVTTFSASQAEVTMSYITGQSHIRIPKTHQDVISDPPERARSKIALTWSGDRWIVDDMYNS
jgi:hypothetical protein